MGRLTNEGFRSLLQPGRPHFYRVSLPQKASPKDISQTAYFRTLRTGFVIQAAAWQGEG